MFDTEILTLDDLDLRMHSTAHEGRRILIRKNDIKYFRFPSVWTLRDAICDYRFVLLIRKNIEATFSSYDEQGRCMPYSEYVDQVSGMAQMQVNPYDANEVWLSYVEVSRPFQRQGLSRVLVTELVKLMRSPWGEGKRLVRSSPSEMGRAYLKDHLTCALESASIPWKFSGDH